MPPGGPLTLRAHAKINLMLSVGPPIADGAQKGFHPIVSWFAAVSLFDTLRLDPVAKGDASHFEVRWATDAPRPSPIDWPLEKDLAVRAHGLMESEVGRPLPVRARLEKRVPVGGGLGGGSADAAAMLMGLDTLFDLHLTKPRLVALGARLGSDVAFFLDEPGKPARPAIVTGLGTVDERVEPVAGHAVLVLPPFGCATGAVYGAFDAGRQAQVRETDVRDTIARSVKDGRIDAAALFNDLESPSCAVEPRLAGIMAQLRDVVEPAHRVHLTGSGSTMFVLCEEGASGAVASTIRAAAPGVETVPVDLV